MPPAPRPLKSLLASSQLASISLGSWALAILGIHRSADRIDDGLFEWATDHAIRVEADILIDTSIWIALASELCLAVWLAGVLLRSRGDVDMSTQALRDRVSAGWLAALLCWGPTTAAGSWSVAIVVQDHLAPWNSDVAAVVAACVGLLVFLRLGVPGWIQIAARSPAATRRRAGWVWVPLATAVTALAIRHGLPVWGA